MNFTRLQKNIFNKFQEYKIPKNNVTFHQYIERKDEKYYPVSINIDNQIYYFYLNKDKEDGWSFLEFNYNGFLNNIQEYPNHQFIDTLNDIDDFFKSYEHIFKNKKNSTAQSQEENLLKITSYFNNEGYFQISRGIKSMVFIDKDNLCTIMINKTIDFQYLININDQIKIKYKNKFPLEEILKEMESLNLLPKNRDEIKLEQEHPILNINKKIQNYCKNAPKEPEHESNQYKKYVLQLRSYLKEGEDLVLSIQNIEVDSLYLIDLTNKNKALLLRLIHNQKFHYKKCINTLIEINSKESSEMLADANKLLTTI